MLKKIISAMVGMLLLTAVGCSGGSSEGDGGIIVIELYPEYAPETVANFVKLVEEGFFDGLTFHRIVDGFMAQGGDPKMSGSNKTAKAIKGEFSENGFSQNTLKHTKGVISMARTNDKNSASSQFFIMLDANTGLDGKYAAFGEVIEGMDVIDSFQTVERTRNSMNEMATPVEPVVMKKVTMLKTDSSENPKVQIVMGEIKSK